VLFDKELDTYPKLQMLCEQSSSEVSEGSPDNGCNSHKSLFAWQNLLLIFPFFYRNGFFLKLKLILSRLEKNKNKIFHLLHVHTYPFPDFVILTCPYHQDVAPFGKKPLH